MVERLASLLTTAGVFVVVLSVLVVAHELGHYLAARLVGIRVDVFSVGFGPRLFGWRTGATEWRFSAVPLGGYVRMAGDGLASEDTGGDDELESKGAWAKIFVFVMGPAASVGLGVVLLALAHLIGIETPAYLLEPVRIEHVQPGTSAERAGLVTGDLILAVDGIPTPDWEGFLSTVALRPGASAVLSVRRGEETRSVPVEVDRSPEQGTGWLAVHPCHQVVLLAVTPAGAAAAAGLEVGDAVLRVDGQAACNPDVLVALLQTAGAQPVVFDIERLGTAASIEVTPRWNSARSRFMVGIAPGLAHRDLTLRRASLSEALSASVATNLRNAGLVFEIVVRLVKRQLPMTVLSGPVGLAVATTEQARVGLAPLLQLMAFISLQLGIFNLLPIPVLDGGRILIYAVEGIRGRHLADRTKIWILQAGAVMIGGLLVTVLCLELIRLLEN